jgi:hypothetical protein
MSVGLELLLRVAVMAVVLSVVGAAVATWLPASLPRFTRVALVPALGLSALLGPMTTLNWLLPASTIAWVVLVPAIALSLLVFFHRRGASRLRICASDALVVVVLVTVVAGSYLGPMIERNSLGPIAYQVYDAPNYAALTDGLENNAIGDPVWGPKWDFASRIGEKFGHSGVQQVGFDSLAASVNSAAGFGSITTQSAFMFVLVLIGVLGAAAAVAAFAPKWRPAWVLGGLLFGGPLVYQLWLDGSEAALAGLALLAPALLLGSRLLDGRATAADAAFFALFSAGLHTAYPLTFPTFAITTAAIGLVWFCLNLAELRSKGMPAARAFIARVGAGVLIIVIGTVVLSPWAFKRNVSYWYNTLTSDAQFIGLPQFDLPFPVLPSYVFQTREFYFLPHLSDVSVQQWITGDVVPLLLLAVACFAVARVPRLVPVAAFAAVGCALAFWASTRADCSYCVQRTLLPVGPALAIMVSVGVAALALLPRRFAKATGWLALLLVMVFVGHAESVLIRRALFGSYMMPSEVSRTASQLRGLKGPVLVEGAGSTLASPAEFQVLIHAARQEGRMRVSFPTETDDFAGLSYLGGVRPVEMAGGGAFSTDYRIVFTRLPSIETQRRTISRNGPFALEERARPFDVTIVSGVVTPAAGQDGSGTARIFAPMTFWISGPPGPAPDLLIEITGISASQVVRTSGMTVRGVEGGRLELCVPSEQRGALRRLVVVTAGLEPALAPPPQFENRPTVIPGPTLNSMRAVMSCGAR